MLRARVNDLRSEVHKLKQKEQEQAVLRGKKKLSDVIKEGEKLCSEMNEPRIIELENRLNMRCMCTVVRNVCLESRARASLEQKFSKLNSLVGNARAMLEETALKGYMRPVESETIVGQERRNEIWDKVSSDEEKRHTICIIGPMGVGKTAIAISIHNQALEDEHDGMFDYVIWVTLEYNDGLLQVQEKIAKQLGLVLSAFACGSTSGRARSIEENLVQKGKFLLVLDSLWKHLSLQEIGIPALGNNKKLIVTSRIRTICDKIPPRDVFIFEVQPLAPPKPLILFDKATNFHNLQQKLNHDNHSRTSDVVAGLDGIPWAINYLANSVNSIRDDATTDFNFEWKKALDMVGNPEDQELMNRFIPSYDNLERTAKQCFLYCASLPKELTVQIQGKQLIEYWILEGLLDPDIGRGLENKNKTLLELVGYGRKILAQLKNGHLLEKEGSTGEEKFKMLSLVRTMGVHILATQEDKFPWAVTIFKPRANRKHLTRLLHSDLNPEQLKGLSMLLLPDIPLNSDYLEPSFFNSMPNLRVVDLSRTDISTLPISLSDMTNLRALVLRRCEKLVNKLPDLSKLQQLILLDLSGTPIRDLPRGIEDMRKLRRLDLSQTRLTSFPAGVVDKLSELEEMLMITSAGCRGNVWGSKELKNNVCAGSEPKDPENKWPGGCVEDLLVLNNIAVLQLNFLNGKVLDVYVKKSIENHGKVPQNFCFCVGEGLHSSIVGAGENSVSIIGDHSLSSLPSTTRELHLTSCCADKISELTAQIRCFRLSKLQVLGVFYITGLTHLFPAEIFESLTELREIRVENCENIVDIVEPVAVEHDQQVVISLPALSKMVFSHLPQLTTLCGSKGLNCPLLASVEVWSCPTFISLPIIYYGSRGSENPCPPNKIQIQGNNKSWIQNFDTAFDQGTSHPHFEPYPRDCFQTKLGVAPPPHRECIIDQQQDSDNTMHASGKYKYSIEQRLKMKRRYLGILIGALKQKQEMGVVLASQLSLLIRDTDALILEVDMFLITNLYYNIVDVVPETWTWASESLSWLKLKEEEIWMHKKLEELTQYLEKVKNLSLKREKGHTKKSEEVVIVGEMRTQAKKEIWEVVSKEAEGRPGTICIHGTLGVGKTAIAICIHNQALEVEDLFDHVIWVDVQYGEDLRKVQEAIAQSMAIELPMNNLASRAGNADDIVVERAMELRNALLQRGKFLLVLDSVWHPLSLDHIGIPPLVNGRKLVVTSRVRTVCDGIINKASFEIQPLSVAEDTWEIFDGQSPSLEMETAAGIKEALLEGSDGLPLAITTFAQSLTDAQDWREQLDKLSSDPKLFNQLEISYNTLSEATKSCFKYCALFPSDYLIESRHLIEFWRLEGLLGLGGDTLAKGNQKGEEVLNQLVNAHLLHSQTGGNVKMLSNLVRSMTINLETTSNPTDNVFIRPGCSLSELPLSLNDIGHPDFSRLSTLSLQDSDSLDTLPSDLFSKMPELQVVDLSRTMIDALPKSLLALKNLRALLLRNCANLKHLPNMSNLLEVIVLDLSGTPLKGCPRSIQKMKKLRRLNLSQTNLKTFPSSILTHLIELEELLMITAMDLKWGSNEDKQWKGLCIEDLVKLEKLGLLHLHFRNKQALDNYVNTVKGVPQTFNFRVGKLHSVKNDEENSLTISGLSGITLANSPSEPFQILNLLNVNYLYVYHFSDLSHLFSAEILNYLTQLRKLLVQGCKEMVEVVQKSAQDQDTIIYLPQLTSMTFIELPRLKTICHERVLDCPNLGSIQVWRCENLELPMSLSLSNKVQIIGERTWYDQVNNNRPVGHSGPRFSFREFEGDVPPDLIHTTTHRVAEQGTLSWIWSTGVGIMRGMRERVGYSTQAARSPTTMQRAWTL